MNLMVKPDRRRTAIVNLAAAGAAALVLGGAWWAWHESDPLALIEPGLEDVRVDWQCPLGHAFRAYGSLRAARCPRCGRPSEISVSYICAQHGELDALVRYRREPDGPSILDKVSFGQTGWQSVRNSVRCPFCREPVRVKGENVFDNYVGQRGQRE